MNWRALIYGIFHMPCLFRAFTGLYCPGCGGTRALRYLLHGQIGLSLRYHPLVLYGAVVLALELISAAAAKLSKEPNRYLGHETAFVYIAVGIVVVNWIWKNVMLIGFGINLI